MKMKIDRSNFVTVLSGTVVAFAVGALMTSSILPSTHQMNQTALAVSTTIAKAPINMSNPTTSANNNVSKNNVIVQQGTVSSGPPMGPSDMLRLAQILNLRPDGSIYTGTLTFTASKRVNIFVLHAFDIGSSSSSSTVVNSTYREPENFPLAPGLQVAASVISPNYRNSFIPSESIPFSGNA